MRKTKLTTERVAIPVSGWAEIPTLLLVDDKVVGKKVTKRFGISDIRENPAPYFAPFEARAR